MNVTVVKVFAALFFLGFVSQAVLVSASYYNYAPSYYPVPVAVRGGQMQGNQAKTFLGAILFAGILGALFQQNPYEHDFEEQAHEKEEENEHKSILGK